MDTKDYIILALALVVLVLIIVLIIVASKAKNSSNVKVKDGVRFTGDKKTNDQVTYYEKDVILEKNKEYIVEKNSYLIPGKYIILSSDGATKFNVRVAGIVKEFEHGQQIVLSIGETVTAVSNQVILR
ncbi:MAG: hypothetical protein LBV58_00955 [Acholeplasmatales bacterium]|jgi:hypothetical protein|nr:hypothetical protein [Acholeplasmatales bacterium]